MSLWLKRTINELERLNPQLTMTSGSDGMIDVTHQIYGPVTVLCEEDKNPVGIIRELLSELAEEYHGKDS